jgi:hypothetical protein
VIGTAIGAHQKLQALAGWLAAAGWISGWIVLCTGNQTLIVGFSVAVLAWWFRRIQSVSGAALLVVGVGIIAWRWTLIGHFEGGYGFGDLEVTVAYLGNPERHFEQAVLRVVFKVLAPLGSAISLLFATQTHSRAKAILTTVLFVLVARIAHVSLGIAAEPTSFYSTYLLVGEIAYQAALLAGLWTVWGLLSLSKRNPVRASLGEASASP